MFENQTNEELLTLYKRTKDLKIKQELALRYLYIVRSIAVQMRDVYAGFTQIEDIVNEGVLMLMSAIDKYDEDKNTKFETYVSKRIRGMIIDIARKQDWVPRTVRKTLRNINNASNEFYAEKGRPPTMEELADALQMEPQKLRETMGKGNLLSILSLDMILEETGEMHRTVQIPSDKREEQPEENFMDQEYRKMLSDGIQSLQENERMVISLYYMEELNMKQIASIMQVSEPRISQIHANAIKKLQKYITDSNGDYKKEGYYVSGVL